VKPEDQPKKGRPEEQIAQLEKSFRVDLKQIVEQWQELDLISVRAQFQGIKNKYLGAESGLNSILKSLKEITDPAVKTAIGQKSNELKIEITSQLESSLLSIEQKIIDKEVAGEKIDATTPGTHQIIGNSHIISQTVTQIEEIFTRMGFEVEYSYDIDTPFNTFDALNIPETHPARDSWDTLWLSDGNLAIPHSTAMQNRIIKNNDLPMAKVVLGKCFRNEATDARHEHSFMQCDGVYLATQASMGEMVGVLLEFFENFFGKKLRYKFSPDFFPFTEPGGQMAIECVICGGEGECKVCKSSGYLEVLGCGMVHPNVIKQAGKDPAQCKGFAWGFGVERLALLKHDVNDIRNFYAPGNLKFLERFN